MWDNLKEMSGNFFKSRLLPITFIYMALFAILVNRLFTLQIVEGEAYARVTEDKTTKTRTTRATRGNIYDCNGKLLAYNELSYNVTYSGNDITGKMTSEERNKMIYRLIRIIEKNDASLSVEFYIEYDKNGNPEFNIDGSSLLRFKAEVYGTTTEKMTQEMKDASAQEIYDFLRYDDSSKSPKFMIGDEYDDEMALKIMSVRYAMFINRFKQYQPITLVNNVDDVTMASIKEHSYELPGIDITENMSRVYKNSKYFAHILGYTGSVSAERLAEIEENDPDTDYTTEDQIGISGIENTFEDELKGKKGTEELTVNETTSRIVGIEKKNDSVAGNDVYLTIDSDLQIECYHLLEEHIAGILLSKLNNGMDAGSKGHSSDDIRVPIYDVYNALIENNVIDVSRFTDKNASSLEKSTHNKYKKKSKELLKRIKDLLASDSKVTSKDLSDRMQDIMSYFYTALKDDGIVLTDKIDTSDSTYKGYINGKISLSKYLQYAISMKWVDLSKLDIGDMYLSTGEIYDKLVEHGLELIKNDNTFIKMVYSYLIYNMELSGRDCCILLFDQGSIKYNANEYSRIKSGAVSAYSFLYNKIKKLQITPGQLGLEPCSGSIVVTDTQTGDVKAMVTYPSYDNNKMANQVDSDYFYSHLTQSTASPLINRPTQQQIAPGSTFKLISTVAGLEEGVISTGEGIYDHTVFDGITGRLPRCWSSSSHGNVTASSAIAVSCNYFFYTVGYRLGNGNPVKKTVNNERGLSRLKRYAKLFGLTSKSGVEIAESSPHFSTEDVVRSAIGQGSHSYTPSQLSRYVTTVANSGTCYDLTLLDKIVSVDGNKVKDNQAKVKNVININQSTWDTVHRGMYMVVNSGLNSSMTNMFENLKVTVAGKTGTAQQNTSHANHAYFVSYAPYNKPKISVTCVIPNGYTSSNAAQTVRDVYKYYFSKKGKKGKKKVSGGIKMPESSVTHSD